MSPSSARLEEAVKRSRTFGETPKIDVEVGDRESLADPSDGCYWFLSRMSGESGPLFFNVEDAPACKGILMIVFILRLLRQRPLCLRRSILRMFFGKSRGLLVR